MRAHRWLKRLHVHTPIGSTRPSPSQSRNGHDDAVKARDERLYGGMKSLDIVLEDGGKAPWKSWKWHAWQSIAATLPALGIYLTAKYIESTHEYDGDVKQRVVDSSANTVSVERDKEGKEERQETTSEEDSTKIPSNVLAGLEERIHALEAQLASLRTEATKAGETSTTHTLTKR